MTRDRKWRSHVMFNTPTAEMTHAGYVYEMTKLACEIAAIKDEADRAVAYDDLGQFSVWLKAQKGGKESRARTFAEFRGWVRPPLGSRS